MSGLVARRLSLLLLAGGIGGVSAALAAYMPLFGRFPEGMELGVAIVLGTELGAFAGTALAIIVQGGRRDIRISRLALWALFGGAGIVLIFCCVARFFTYAT